MFFLILALLAALAVFIFLGFRRSNLTILAHSHEFLDRMRIPATDFYEAVRAGLAERQITEVSLKEESFLERHLFSAKRLYLRITQHEYVFYVCAAPYGTGTFISSWLCVKDERFYNRIPLLSKLMGKDRRNKTFYQMDTEGMFRDAVHATVAEAVHILTAQSGMRGFAELRMPQMQAV